METKPNIPVNADIRSVATNEIVPDPNQPRKTFYKMTMEELESSIKKDGILQSLLLRRQGEKYMIIAGERRHKIAVKLNIQEVPAIVIDANDEEALRKQLVENLHREDVPVMEQATAFRMLAEKCQMNVQDIAINTGKSVYFVRQQIKLTDLIPQWQKMISKNAVAISTALQISVLPQASQKELYQNHVSKEDEKAARPTIQINSYTLNKYKGVLSEASFDITDATLDSKMGACTSCPFNTACHSLFPEEQETPRCNNIACFNNKTTTYLNREFNKAKDDPTLLLVYDANSTPDYVKKLKAEGTEIFKMGYADDCKEIKEPNKPDWKQFCKWSKKQNHSEKKIKTDFKKEEENYAFAKEVFEKNIASGKYKKAFVIYDEYGGNTGQYKYVEINSKKTTAKDAQKVISGGSATKEDMDNEIARLRDREKRAKELDAEKVQERIVLALKECKAFGELPKTSNRVDTVLINFLLCEAVGFSNRSAIEKIIKPAVLSNSVSPAQFYKILESLSKQQVSFLIRQIIMEKYGNNLPTAKGGIMIRKMAESLNLVPIADFEKEQKEKAMKRQQRVNERIEELTKHKQQLAKSKKSLPAAKQNEKQEAA